MTNSSASARGTAVCVMLGAHEDWLKVSSPPTAEIAVIGWVQPTLNVDAGIPENIAALLSRALTRSFRVTFLDPEQAAPFEWLAHKDRWTRSLPASGWAGLFRSKAVTLVSTSNEEVAQTLFHSGAAWDQEAQVVMLTNPGHLPPDLRDDVLSALLRKGEIEGGSELVALLLPGPDGDFAQFVGLQEGSLSAFLRHLEYEANAAGIAFAIISPQVFAQTRWVAEGVER